MFDHLPVIEQLLDELKPEVIRALFVEIRELSAFWSKTSGNFLRDLEDQNCKITIETVGTSTTVYGAQWSAESDSDLDHEEFEE